MNTTTTAPAEPPVGTLVRDRHGAIHRRYADGWGDQYDNTWHLGVWAAMWEGRGPLVEVTKAHLAEERAAEATTLAAPARPRRTPHPDTREHGDHAMTTTTLAPAADITHLLPIGRVAEVTAWDAGTQTRITGTVTGHARDGRWPSRRRPIAGVWVGDSWVSTEEVTAPETRVRLCGPGEAAAPLTNAGIPVTLEDTRPGDVLYVAFPDGDSVIQALGPVDAVDPGGQWVGLDGEMTLAVGVPFFTIRRVAAAEQREAQ